MMPETDWNESYFQQQMRWAEKLGCAAHPNNIDAALGDLQRRAAGGDRKRARRRARLKAGMIKALKSEGVTTEELKGVDDDLGRLVQRLVKP
jgi:hypothetical protein